MKPPFHPRRSQASALMVTIFALCALSALAGTALLNVASKSRTAYRSAAWNEAMTTANAGVDMVVADLGALLPDVRVNPQEGVALGVSQLPLDIISSLKISSAGANLDSGLTLSLQPAPLLHGGEGSGRQQATVSLDVLPLSSVIGSLNSLLSNLPGILSNPLNLLNGGPDLQLIRLRSRGTVEIGASRMADTDSRDSVLRRPSLVWDRVNNRRATMPSISREVEVLLRPVLPFQSAITTSGRLSLPSPDSVVDSYNSNDPAASSSGLYSSAKRLTNGTVIAGGSDVQLGGYLYGDLRTNGSTLEKTDRISGSVDNGYAQPMPVVQPPSWVENTSVTIPPLLGSTTIPAGSVLFPARRKFDRITGTVNITRDLLGLNTEAEIYVTGDVTGTINIDPGVRVKLYLGGHLRMNAGRLNNRNKQASFLQIYGVGEDPVTGPRSLELELGNVTAAIYAPRHYVILTGTGDFQGAITAANLTASEGAHIHFDEALALNTGPVLRFAVASWIEREL